MILFFLACRLFSPARTYLGTTATRKRLRYQTMTMSRSTTIRGIKGPRVRSAGSDESEIRERNELADGRDEPVYSRPTFPSGTSNLNSSHQSGASSSSGRRWVLHRWGTNPTCSATSRLYLYIPVHTAIALSSTFSSSSSLPPPSEVCRRSSSFRKSPLVPVV